MIKKTITYKDFNGKERTDDFYFHLTQAEIMDWERETEGGLIRKLITMTKTSDVNEVVGMVKDIILRSYGQKSLDGLFIKNKETTDRFIYSQAFSDLYVELVSDPEKCADFVKGIVPTFDEKRAEEAEKVLSETDSVEETLARFQMI